jgi:hypothetical protein
MAVQQQANVQRKVNWELHYVDGTMVRAHQHAAGVRGKLGRRGFRPQPRGFQHQGTSRAEGGGKLITLVLTPGQRHKAPLFPQLMAQGAVKGAKGRPRLRPHRVVGDKGYSSRAIRQYARQHGIRITIPHKVNECRKGLLIGRSTSSVTWWSG